MIAVTLRNDPTSTLYALKILMKDKLPPINTTSLMQHETLQSDFLVKIIRIAEEEKRISILMEHMESSDLNYYRKKAGGTFPEDVIRDTAAEVVVALEFLHAHNIVYKFLKPENIMLTNEGHIKLTDYVLSKLIDNSRLAIDRIELEPASAESAKNPSKMGLLGSVEYMAPCMFNFDQGNAVVYEEFTKAVDIWTLGVLLYELKNGQTPFGGKDPKVVREQIEKVEYSFTGKCSSELNDLIRSILVKDPSKRPTLQ